tara:strand:+ start:167 stop:295 length:129 start_codon:yes stop_codon:yes gene_type:complete
MDYTDFANGETRNGPLFSTEDIAKYNTVRANAQKIIDILTND